VKQVGQHTFEANWPRGSAARARAVHMREPHRGVRASPRNRVVNSRHQGKCMTDQGLLDDLQHGRLVLGRRSSR